MLGKVGTGSNLADSCADVTPIRLCWGKLGLVPILLTVDRNFEAVANQQQTVDLSSTLKCVSQDLSQST